MPLRSRSTDNRELIRLKNVAYPQNASGTKSFVENWFASKAGAFIVLADTADGSYVQRGDLREMTDTVTEGYYALVKQGAFLPMNPMSSSHICTSEVGSALFRGMHLEPYPYNSSGVSAGAEFILPPPTHIDHSYDMNDLVSDSIADARSRVFDAGTFAAEMGDTIQMFTNAKKNMKTILNRMRKDIDLAKKAKQAGKLASAVTGNSGTTRSMSELWLTYRYGIKPLINDLLDLQAHLSKPPGKYLVRGKAKRNYVQTSQEWVTIVPDLQILVETTTETLYRVSSVLEVSSNEEVTLDPVATAYEVLKLSFVLDWIFNIGSTIAARSPFQIGTVKGVIGSKTQSSVSQAIAVRYVLNGDPDYYSSESSFSGNLNVASTKRSVTRDTLSSSGRFAMRLNINSERILDGLSLLRVFARD